MVSYPIRSFSSYFVGFGNTVEDIFRPQTEEATADCKKNRIIRTSQFVLFTVYYYNDEIRVYDIGGVRIMQSSDEKSIQNFLSENLKVSDHLENLGGRREDNIKMRLKGI
jgi:hypothetical protein